MNRPAAFRIIILPLALTACDGAADSSAPIVRDSAGIRIVEHRALEVSPWELPVEPVFALGTLEGDEMQQLYTATHALRRADGGIVVANRGTQELRFFGPGGEHLRTVGGEGGGPGEFERMGGLTRVRGDSLAVWDRAGKRLTVFAADGNVGRVVAADVAGFSPVLIGPLDEDHVAIIDGLDAVAVFATSTGVRDDSAAVLKVALGSGAPVDTLGPYPAAQRYASVSETMFWMNSVIFGRKRLINAAGGRVHVANDRTGEVRSYDPDGRLLSILRAGEGPGPVTSEAEQRYRDRELENVSADRLAEERRRLAETPTADRFPVFDDLFADRLGRVWLRMFDPDLGETRRWVVFDADGRAAGRVDLPERFEPLDAGAAYVLFRSRDELDVERLLLYALESEALGPP